MLANAVVNKKRLVEPKSLAVSGKRVMEDLKAVETMGKYQLTVEMYAGSLRKIHEEFDRFMEARRLKFENETEYKRQVQLGSTRKSS